MSSDTASTGTPAAPAPNDRLRETGEAAAAGDSSALAGSALGGFVLLKLDSYQKPPLAEDLSAPSGDAFGGSCTCNSVCTCVPVQTCACDAVCTCDAVQGCSVCASYSCHGGGGGGYWQPCF